MARGDRPHLVRDVFVNESAPGAESRRGRFLSRTGTWPTAVAFPALSPGEAFPVHEGYREHDLLAGEIRLLDMVQ